MSRELDARVAVEVFGDQVVGEAICWAPDGVWTVKSNSVIGELRPVSVVRDCFDNPNWHDELRADYPTLVEREDWLFGHHRLHCLDVVPQYSELIECAWLVVEKMRRSETDHLGHRGMELELSCVPLGAKAYPPNAQWLAGFHDDGPTYQAWGATAPEAICLAALKAVEE